MRNHDEWEKRFHGHLEALAMTFVHSANADTLILQLRDSPRTSTVMEGNILGNLTDFGQFPISNVDDS